MLLLSKKTWLGLGEVAPMREVVAPMREVVAPMLEVAVPVLALEVGLVLVLEMFMGDGDTEGLATPPPTWV